MALNKIDLTLALSSRQSNKNSNLFSPKEKKMGKQRSFTTSILVSPQTDRKVILYDKQQSMEKHEKEDARERTLRSGDVVVEIKKVSWRFLNTTFFKTFTVFLKSNTLLSSVLRHSNWKKVKEL